MKHKLTGVIFTTAMVLFLLTGVTLTAAAEDPLRVERDGYRYGVISCRSDEF